MRRAIFLDRDGTLNLDTGYVHTKEAWRWLPGVPEALAALKAQGWFLVVVSNQSGIARGMFTTSELHALEKWVNGELTAAHATIDAWYHCPHLPEITGSCCCRKPAPGMLLRASAEHGIALAESWMIGDAPRDVEAGLACGVQSIKLGPPLTACAFSQNRTVPHFSDLASAVNWITQTS